MSLPGPAVPSSVLPKRYTASTPNRAGSRAVARRSAKRCRQCQCSGGAPTRSPPSSRCFHSRYSPTRWAMLSRSCRSSRRKGPSQAAGFSAVYTTSIAPTDVCQMEMGERCRQGVSTKSGRAWLRPRYSMRAVVISGYCQPWGSASSTRVNTAGGGSPRWARAATTAYRHRSSFALSRRAASSSFESETIARSLRGPTASGGAAGLEARQWRSISRPSPNRGTPSDAVAVGGRRRRSGARPSVGRTPVPGDRARSVVVLRDEAVVQWAHQTDRVWSMVAAEAEGIAVVELQAVTLGAATALLVQVTALHPVSPRDEALDGCRDVP